MSEPNAALRSARIRLRLSQDELARAVRAAGDRAGEPNDCSKRLVQRWEAGVVKAPRAVYVRALEAVTGQPIGNLGFADERYGVDRDAALAMAGDELAEAAEASSGAYSGIWRSTYEYPSSSRGRTYSSSHYVLLIQRGARLTVRSLPGTANGRLVMDLDLNGQVVTGKWTERTDQSGYYQGSVYHGAIQMLADPTGHRISGRWVGYGRDFEINDGPWTLELVTADTGPEAQAAYDRPVPEPEAGG